MLTRSVAICHGRCELCDLLEDPAELSTLLVGDVPEGVEQIVDELALLLHQWREQTGTSVPRSSPGHEFLSNPSRHT